MVGLSSLRLTQFTSLILSRLVFYMCSGACRHEARGDSEDLETTLIQLVLFLPLIGMTRVQPYNPDFERLKDSP